MSVMLITRATLFECPLFHFTRCCALSNLPCSRRVGKDAIIAPSHINSVMLSHASMHTTQYYTISYSAMIQSTKLMHLFAIMTQYMLPHPQSRKKYTEEQLFIMQHPVYRWARLVSGDPVRLSVCQASAPVPNSEQGLSIAVPTSMSVTVWGQGAKVGGAVLQCLLQEASVFGVGWPLSAKILFVAAQSVVWLFVYKQSWLRWCMFRHQLGDLTPVKRTRFKLPQAGLVSPLTGTALLNRGGGYSCSIRNELVVVRGRVQERRPCCARCSLLSESVSLYYFFLQDLLCVTWLAGHEDLQLHHSRGTRQQL